MFESLEDQGDQETTSDRKTASKYEVDLGERYGPLLSKG